ncbi:MAG: SAM-dependent methyltransferase [Myxococcota bacterium]
MIAARLAGSFRDPSGHLFRHAGRIYRQVNASYREDYDRLMASGFYAAAARDGSLLPHEEVELVLPIDSSDARSQSADRGAAPYKILLPEQLPFVSYPYEWSFSQLKDAALLTLRIQKTALDFGLSLKDASAFNVQFLRGRPVFIDTLSLERHPENRPWVAYRQFCSHFLAPLALMAYRDPECLRWLRVELDGMPLDLASRLLPWRTRCRIGLLIHLHWHARSQRVHADRKDSAEIAMRGGLSKAGLVGILESLENCIRHLDWQPRKTEWSDYYAETNYSSAAESHKLELVDAFLDAMRRPRSVWDLGGNTGRYGRLAARRGIPTISFDRDHAAIEESYRRIRAEGETSMLPLVMDLSNPTPAIGWGNEERMSLIERGPADVVMALALVHHLAIGNNVPLARIAAYLRSLCKTLILEFVPKSDSQVQRLLRTRDDIFPNYHAAGFEEAFAPYFSIRRRETIRESERVLYWLEASGGN